MRQVIEPRGLTREQAAAYVGVSPSQFMELVVSRKMPAPKRLGAQLRWDRFEIDRVLDATDASLRNIADWQELVAAVAPILTTPETASRLPTREELEKDEAEWRRTIRRTPLDKRERIALSLLYDRRDGVRESDLPKGLAFRTERRLLARAYVTVSGEQPHGWSLWKITKRGIAAVEAEEAKM